MTALDTLLACPRCDKTPLTVTKTGYHCPACKTDFDSINGIPFLFADPDASLGEWRGRMQRALTQLSHDVAALDNELADKNLRLLTRRRLERLRKAQDHHRRSLARLTEPLDVQSLTGNHESYLALRTRLPTEQGLNTYYNNVHRDWCWGDEENTASLNQIQAVAQGSDSLGDTLVLGAGAGRLAYDIHMHIGGDTTIAFDFNPLLLLVAQQAVTGDPLNLYEFPIAPYSLDDEAVLRKLAAPEPVRDGFELVLGDALRAPFAPGSFDTVVTPWLIDVVGEDFASFAARINRLLKKGGRWINFGSLAYATPERAQRLSAEEAKEIIGETGFSNPYVSEQTIPYMCSPASRHGRQERVFTFSATKQKDGPDVSRHRALPDWIVTGKESVPLSPAFRTQAMTTQIYAFMMSLIDGKRSIVDMADVMESQRLMTRDEAIPAIRQFLIRMHDDAGKAGM